MNSKMLGKKVSHCATLPLIVGLLASVFYITDSFVGKLFVSGGSFMWVGFVFWTVFLNASIKDRIKALIGTVIGFGAGCLMMWITSLFTINVLEVSISGLIGVFIVNFLIIFFEYGEKLWLNSLAGIFCGITLTFSGLGVGLNPLHSFKSAATMIGVIIVYAVIGLVCGFVNGYYAKHLKEIKK